MQTAFLVFGLTGNLMRYKGIPALFSLYQKRALPEGFAVIGLSRKEWSRDAIRAHIAETLDKTPEEIADFASLFSMAHGVCDDPSGYPEIKELVGPSAQLIAYLCVSPGLHMPIIENLEAHGMLGATSRIIIEKPFGRSLKSAHALQELLLKSVSEEQIFRVDHYLAKDAVEKLLKNNPKDIASIEVRVLEAAGAEGRGAVYDALGALRDVGQNHMLEMLAATLGAKSPEERGAVLRGLHALSPEEMGAKVTRGQYAGYTDIDGVTPHSRTETYFKIETMLEAGGRHIPVLLEAGKRLATPKKEIVVRHADGSATSLSLESRDNEYETLFAGVLLNDRSHFVSLSEVEALWSFVDPIEAQWEKGELPLVPYAPDSDDILQK